MSVLLTRRGEAKQASAVIFRTRDLLVGQRTQITNALRGHLPASGSGEVVCSSSLLLRDLPGRRQAETPLIAPVQIPWATSR